MQSKPDSQYVIYINFDGYTIRGIPFPFNPLTDPNQAFSWVSFANQNDTNGSPIHLIPFKWISIINVPPTRRYSNQDKKQIFDFVSKKYEIFDVNITTVKSVFESADKNKRYMVIVTDLPTPDEMNSLIDDKTENGNFPYSYRRLLLGRLDPDLFGNEDVKLAPFWQALGITIRDEIIANFPSLIDKSTAWPSFCFSNAEIDAFMNVSAGANPFRGYMWSEQTQNTASTKIMGFTVAHEVGHLLGLQHDGQSDSMYYAGHNNWVPIMGSLNTEQIYLHQWSKGEYADAVTEQPQLIKDDILVINQSLPLIKKPIENSNSIDYSDFEKETWPKELGYNIRTITTNDVKTIDDKNGKQIKVIQGMIGFPYDFEILKICLPAGEFTFQIDPLSDINEYTMFDPQIEILNCNCQESKEDNNPECDSNLPTFYPLDIDANKKQCIAFNDNVDSKYTKSIKSAENDDFFTARVTNSNYSGRHIVYLKIRGGKNKTPQDGWSRYGSVGKYNLEIFGSLVDGTTSNDPSTFLSETILPKSRCEEFKICSSQTILYIEDESGGPQGNENEEHFIELEYVENGAIVTKKFLVYGQPIDKDTNLDTDEYRGRFFLTVDVNGECKKQEFIIGTTWELRKN